MRYGLLGEHLKHSFSKEIHEQINDYEYQLIEVAKNDLDEFMNKREFKAINVTIPYKEMVIPYLYYIDDNAKRIGAVNTIVNRNNKLYGYNTDYYGLRDLILKNEINVKDKKVNPANVRAGKMASSPPKLTLLLTATPTMTTPQPP